MPTRSINSFLINFGLVSIPVKMYTLRQDEHVEFHLLHRACNSRLSQQMQCTHCQIPVTPDERVKGYEVAKDQHLPLDEHDLATLQADRTKTAEITEFIPLGDIDPAYFQSAYFVGPDKGSERAYRLLFQAMLDTGNAALAQLTLKGKETLFCFRPYKNGIAMHELFYASEFRNLEDVEIGAQVELSADEISLARTLVNATSVSDFEPEKYTDHYRERVLELIERKKEGVVSAAPTAPATPRPVIDLMAALKASVAKTAGPATKAKKRKA